MKWVFSASKCFKFINSCLTLFCSNLAWRAMITYNRDSATTTKISFTMYEYKSKLNETSPHRENDRILITQTTELLKRIWKMCSPKLCSINWYRHFHWQKLLRRNITYLVIPLRQTCNPRAYVTKMYVHDCLK